VAGQTLDERRANSAVHFVGTGFTLTNLYGEERFALDFGCVSPNWKGKRAISGGGHSAWDQCAVRTSAVGSVRGRGTPNGI
jgi:hypothetical protein